MLNDVTDHWSDKSEHICIVVRLAVNLFYGLIEGRIAKVNVDLPNGAIHGKVDCSNNIV